MYKVLKKRLALVSPTLVADAFMYEEGPDLEPDEAAESAAFRPVALAALPGGGIRNGAIVAVSDQAQAFEAQLVVSHRVGRRNLLQCTVRSKLLSVSSSLQAQSGLASAGSLSTSPYCHVCH